MVSSGRSGRKSGPLAGETPEAEELAEWVSKVTKALTLRELEERFEYGRTQWGQFRKGSKVVPGWMVDVLVRELVKNPQHREMQLRLGHQLQKAAEAAAVTREAKASVMPSGTEGELGIRLDEARKTTIEAQKTLLGATQIIFVLLQMVTSLRSRCEVLEREKERAAEQGSVVSVVERELVETRQKVDLVKKKLARARRTRQEAEELHVTAEVTAARHELALERMRAVPPADPESEGLGEEETDSAAESVVSVVEGLPPLWEYDVALEAADQQIDQREAELDGLRAQMGITAQEETEQDEKEVLSGVVVREPPADNADSDPVPADSGFAGRAPDPATEEEERGNDESDDALDRLTSRPGEHVGVVRDNPPDNKAPEQSPDVVPAELLLGKQLALAMTHSPMHAAWRYADLAKDAVRLLGPAHDETFEARMLYAAYTGHAGNPKTAVRLFTDLLTDIQREEKTGYRLVAADKIQKYLKHWKAQSKRDTPRTLFGRPVKPALAAGSRYAKFRKHKNDAMSKGHDPTAAVKAYAKLIVRATNALGPQNDETFEARSHHAAYTGRAGDPATAVRLFTELLTDIQKPGTSAYLLRDKIPKHLQYWQERCELGEHP
ncbi:hypothetical protein ACFT5E_23400 [[Kitasatospora] papulosa]|uniref:hypothetical protein n=1 Tax=[Kitasatospora] papulosa TaxID=1464011 RepID=UPI00364292F2